MKTSTLLLIMSLGFPTLEYSQWIEKNISTNSTLNSVQFRNVDIGYVVGGNDIFKTEDGGDNWEMVYSNAPLISYEDLIIIEEEIIIAVGFDFDNNQSVITKSFDDGLNWTNINVSTSTLLNSIYFSSSTIGYCAGSGGTLLKSTDSGNTWVEQNTGTSINLNSVSFVNNLVGVAVGGDPISSVIIKTQDGGNTWSEITNPSNNNLRSIFFSTGDIAYVVGWNGEIIKTEDCGDTWTSQNSVSMNGNLEVVFTDENTGYIVGGSVNESLIQKTTNAGELWEDISPETQEGLVSIHFPNFNVGYAVGSNGIVVKTESGGIWTSTNDLKLADKISVFPNPTNQLINIQTEEGELIEKVNLYQSTGTLLETIQPYSNSLKFDISNQPPNVYYLQIYTSDDIFIRKIILKS